MGFEYEEKVPTKNELDSKKTNEEKQEPNIYYLPNYEWLPTHLKYKMLADCVKELGKQKVRLVDYGSGSGRLTNILSTLTACSKELQNIKMEVIGYEPDEEMVKKSIERSMENDFSCVRHTSEQPHEDADIVLCYFSLHHMKDSMEKILEEEIKQKINPEYLIIGEFDYKGNNVTTQEFEKKFRKTDYGNEELRIYQKKYGAEEGLKRCYEEHMKIGLQDCMDALEKIGYEVEDVAMGNKENLTQAMKFLIKAKRAELDKIEYKL